MGLGSKVRPYRFICLSITWQFLCTGWYNTQYKWPKRPANCNAKSCTWLQHHPLHIHQKAKFFGDDVGKFHPLKPNKVHQCQLDENPGHNAHSWKSRETLKCEPRAQETYSRASTRGNHMTLKPYALRKSSAVFDTSSKVASSAMSFRMKMM